MMRYKHTEKTIGQIGQELDVDYILEGGIRRAGSLVRISVRLIQVSDETLVWAQSYNHKLAHNALAIHRSVALGLCRSPEIAALFVVPPQRFARTAAPDSSPEKQGPREALRFPHLATSRSVS